MQDAKLSINRILVEDEVHQLEQELLLESPAPKLSRYGRNMQALFSSNEDVPYDQHRFSQTHSLARFSYNT